MKKLFKIINKRTIERVEKQIALDDTVKKTIKMYYDDNGLSLDLLGIRDIHSENKKDQVLITIELERPGILIGKGGQNIDNLNKYLKDFLEKDISINIKESKFWWPDFTNMRKYDYWWKK